MQRDPRGQVGAVLLSDGTKGCAFMALYEAEHGGPAREWRNGEK